MTIVAELASSRELMSNLTLRELRGKYKRSAIGWAWSLINPLVTMAIFTLVFGVILGARPPVGAPSGLDNFALFLVCALLPWNFVNAGVTGSISSLVANASLVKKVYFPRAVLVASSVVANDVALLIELSVLAVALLVVGNMVLPWLPVVLLLVVIQTMLVVGVGLAVSVLNVYFRDVQHLVAIGIQLWFYATPIVYPLSLVEDKAQGREVLGVDLFTLYQLNPMVGFVESYRDALYHLRFPDAGTLAYITAVSIAALVGGFAIFRRLEPRLAEEL